jgi:hypothetical protein
MMRRLLATSSGKLRASGVAMAFSSKLQEAAEKLVKAAHQDAKANGTTGTATEIASLKQSIASKLNTLYQNTIKLNAKLEADAKESILRWAIENCKVNEFTYHGDECDEYTMQSGELVREILFQFRKGNGRWLPATATLDRNYQYLNEADREDAVSFFHDELVDQIHELTGQKPRVVYDEKGKYSIWYS